MPHTTEPKDGEYYSEDYFINGVDSGKSSYKDYHWLPDTSLPQALYAKRHLGIQDHHTILDFGCLATGTPIITDSGVKPIEEITDLDQVFTHEGRFRYVSKVSFRPYEGDAITLEARYTQSVKLTLTPDHPVLAVDVHRRYPKNKPEIKSEPKWIPASELSKSNHWLAVPIPKQTEDPGIYPPLARLCGYYLSEGYVQKKKSLVHKGSGYIICFCFHRKEEEYAQDVSMLMQTHFGTTNGWVEYDKVNGMKVCFYSREAYHFFKGTFGKGSREKRIPHHWVTGLSIQAAEQLIVGAYNGDGVKSCGKVGFRFDYTTASASLASSMKMLLLRMGAFAELVHQKPRLSIIDGRRITSNGVWHVRVNGPSCKKLGKLLGLTKKEGNREFWHGQSDENYAYIPIKSISKHAYNGMVHNMDVEEDHSYSHITTTVHNCARGFFVKALRMQGMQAYGYDHAEWPIQNCDEAVKPYVSNTLTLAPMSYDHIWMKDVAEHMSVNQLMDLIPKMCEASRKSILIIVPLTSYFGGKYLREEDESDPSHVIRFTLDDWLKFFSGLAKDFAVYGSYHLHGLKPASSQVPHSCGFFRLVRT